jgi:hypothetical protein
MHRIVDLEVRAGHRLRLKFSDGVEGEVDLSGLVGQGVFAAWRDPQAFAQVSIDSQTGTVCWPGGIDLCPDALYHEITGKPLPGVGQAVESG